MKRTPGPWKLRGYQVRAEAGNGAHVATYQISIADGVLIAAAPELLQMLVDVSTLSIGPTQVKTRLAALGLVKLGKNDSGNLSTTVPLASTNPDVALNGTVEQDGISE